MSSAKKARELNRAKAEYDNAKLSAQFAASNHTMLNIAESALAKEIESLRQQLAECQAREAKRIEILNQIAGPESEVSFWWQIYARDALAVPNDATALNELIAERTKTQKEYYESVFQDGANRIAELTAELQSTRLQMITDFGQYQEAHEKVNELTAQRDAAIDAIEMIQGEWVEHCLPKDSIGYVRCEEAIDDAIAKGKEPK